MTTPTKNDQSMPIMPDDFVSYKKTPVFTQDTVPASLQKDHSTAADTWAVIHIETGTLKYHITEPEHEGVYLLDTNKPGVIAAAHAHYVEPLGNVSFYIEFYRKSSEE